VAAASYGPVAQGEVPVAYIGGTYGIHGLPYSASAVPGVLPDLAGGDSTVALQLQHLQGLQNLPVLQQQQLIQQQLQQQQQQQQLQQQQLLAYAASNHSGMSQSELARRRAAGKFIFFN